MGMSLTLRSLRHNQFFPKPAIYNRAEHRGFGPDFARPVRIRLATPPTRMGLPMGGAARLPNLGLALRAKKSAP
jgi:hypothetical protein